MLQLVLSLLALLAAASPAIGQSCLIPTGVDPQRIVPVVRSAASVAASFPASPKVVPQRLLNPELSVLFAENTQGAISYFLIDASEQPCWLDSQVLENSLHNLSREISKVRVVEGENGVFMIAAGGNYEASLILAPRLLRRVTGLSGNLVVGIPNRDLLLVTAQGNDSAIATMRAKVAQFYASGDHPLSTRLFVIDGREISVFGP